MDPKLLVLIAWLALAGTVLIVLSLQLMGRVSGVGGILIVLPLCLVVAWTVRRSRRP